MPSTPTRSFLVASLALSLAGTALASCSDDEAGAGDPAAFCAVVATTDPFPEAFDDLDPGDVPASIEAFSAARAAEVMLEAKAPDAIKDDLGVLVAYLDDLIDGLEATDPTETRPAIYDRLATRSDTVQSASDRVELYVESTCKNDETP